MAVRAELLLRVHCAVAGSDDPAHEKVESSVCGYASHITHIHMHMCMHMHICICICMHVHLRTKVESSPTRRSSGCGTVLSTEGRTCMEIGRDGGIGDLGGGRLRPPYIAEWAPSGLGVCALRRAVAAASSAPPPAGVRRLTMRAHKHVAVMRLDG